MRGREFKIPKTNVKDLSGCGGAIPTPYRKKDLTLFRNLFTINNVYTSGLAQPIAMFTQSHTERIPKPKFFKRVPNIN